MGFAPWPLAEAEEVCRYASDFLVEVVFEAWRSSSNVNLSLRSCKKHSYNPVDVCLALCAALGVSAGLLVFVDS